MSTEIRRCVLTFFGAADGVADGMPLQNTHRVIVFDQRVIPKTPIFMVEVRTLRLELAPSATTSATNEARYSCSTPRNAEPDKPESWSVPDQ
jgi:hypothetical protein